MDKPAKHITTEEVRERIEHFERFVGSLPQIDMPVREYWSGHLYVRELTLPANTWATGRIHKFPCINFLMTGRIEVVTDQGGEEMEGPRIWRSEAGVKRAVHAITKTIWATAHVIPGGEGLSQDELFALMTFGSYDELRQVEGPDETKKIG